MFRFINPSLVTPPTAVRTAFERPRLTVSFGISTSSSIPWSIYNICKCPGRQPADELESTLIWKGLNVSGHQNVAPNPDRLYRGLTYAGGKVRLRLTSTAETRDHHLNRHQLSRSRYICFSSNGHVTVLAHIPLLARLEQSGRPGSATSWTHDRLANSVSGSASLFKRLAGHEL